MLETCELCKSEFLTEADPYVVRPTPQGYKLYCYCQIKGFDEIDPLKTLKARVEKLEKTLRLFAFPEGKLEHDDVERLSREALNN